MSDVFDIGDLQHQQYENAMNHIIWEIRKFVKEIIEDSVSNPNIYAMRLEVSQGHFKFLIHNAETLQIVGKAYPLGEFFEICQNKDKMQFEINMIIKKLIVHSQEKYDTKLRWL